MCLYALPAAVQLIRLQALCAQDCLMRRIAIQRNECCNAGMITGLNPRSRARDLLQAADGRVTPARLAVLEILLGSAAALSHHEIEESIERRGLGVDRVTLYRVLDWLVDRDLAHRIAAADRVWRFNAVDRMLAGEHAHFHCTQCGQIICLSGPGPVAVPALPPGFLRERTEINIHGRCARCAD